MCRVKAVLLPTNALVGGRIRGFLGEIWSYGSVVGRREVKETY